MEALAQVKLALDHGLVNAHDYDRAKAAFLRAQQIRCAFEAGLISPSDDTEYVRRAFLDALKTLNVSEPIISLPAVGEPLPVLPPVPTSTSPPPSAPSPPPPAVFAAPTPTPPSPVFTNHKPKPTSTGPKPSASASGSFGRSVSGVAVAQECPDTFHVLKTRSAHRFITFKIDADAGQVQVDEAGPPDASYGMFEDALPEGDCRFAVYDYAYTNDDGCVFNKIVFVMWSPDCSPLKHKMMYASTKDYFRHFLQGIAMEMQITDRDEIDAAAMHDKVRDTLTRK